MICPHCKSKGFIPSEGFPLPVKNVRTEKFDKFNQRRYICVQCGYKFVTTEKFEREINPPEHISLFEEDCNDRC